jgi:hypothetical protein
LGISGQAALNPLSEKVKRGFREMAVLKKGEIQFLELSTPWFREQWRSGGVQSARVARVYIIIYNIIYGPIQGIIQFFNL